MKKFIGYIFIVIAGYVCAKAGLRFDMWEYWVIVLGFIIGSELVHWED